MMQDIYSLTASSVLPDEIKNFLDDARALCDKRIEERRNNQSGMIYE